PDDFLFILSSFYSVTRSLCKKEQQELEDVSKKKFHVDFWSKLLGVFWRVHFIVELPLTRLPDRGHPEGPLSGLPLLEPRGKEFFKLIRIFIDKLRPIRKINSIL